TTRASVEDKNLLGHRAFEEREGAIAFDDSGQGNNGTLRGGTSWGPGPLGGALRFDGVDGYLEVERGDSVDFSKGPFTFALWMQDTNAGQQTITHKRTTQSDGLFLITLN